MTQVEIPQLSLQRYVDLVKRRSWQLVPVSLLGLLIGGLVAFLIPRFFVAETLLEHQQVPQGASDPRNPFRAVIDTARSTIPLAAGEAMAELKWPEVQSLDEFELGQFERDVESRIRVSDTNGGDRTRSYALIRVEYRDRDGDRSASFLNKLVEVWARRRIEELRAPAEAQRLRATTQADRARRALAGYIREKQDLELQYGFDPVADIGDQRSLWNDQEERRAERREALNKRIADRSALQAGLDKMRDELAEMQARVMPDATNLLTEALKVKAAQPLIQLWLRAKAEYENTYQEGTSKYYNAKRKAQLILQQIKALVPQAAVDADGLMPNPDYAELLKKITAEEGRLKAIDAEIEKKKEQLKAEAERLEQRIEGYGIYIQKLDQIEEAKKAKDDAVAELTRATELLGKLNRELPVRPKRPAVVPPAPTEPNILIVALVGCVLGLGAAIGLILVFDVLQGSFKTLDDVERGLPVPVLGGVAHLETVDERQQSVRSRRRVALVAGSAVAMLTVIVSIFYFDSTMLPTWVTDILRTILGAS